MDEEIIRREASEAMLDLELDSTISSVTHSDNKWCIQFENGYGRFCDTFQNQFDRDNSPRVIREKIKKHLLGQITQLRNKGSVKARKKGFSAEEDRGPDVTELFQAAVTQTTRAIGEAVDRTLGVTGATIKSAGDLSQTISAKATEALEPARIAESIRPATVSAQRRSASGKATKKGGTKRGGTKRKAAAKPARAGRAKKSAGKKKSARKR